MSKYGKNSVKIVVMNVLACLALVIAIVGILGMVYYFGYPRYQEYALQRYAKAAIRRVNDCYDISNYISEDVEHIQKIERTAIAEIETADTREKIDEYADNAIEKITSIDIDAVEIFDKNEKDDISETIVLENEISEETKAILLSEEPSVGSRVNISASSATSTIRQTGVDNSSGMIFDGVDETTWQEGVEGYGIGESVSASFYENVKVKYIGFKLGNWKNDKYYYGNAKPRHIRVVVGDFSQSVEFTGDRREEWIELTNPISADSIRFEIESVYPGTTWDDTCISEIEIREE